MRPARRSAYRLDGQQLRREVDGQLLRREVGVSRLDGRLLRREVV